MYLTFCLAHLFLTEFVGIQADNPLQGKHLRVVAVEFSPFLTTKRNASGNVLQAEGPLVNLIESLSHQFRFSYSFLPYPTWTVEDVNQDKGALYYLENKEADYALSLALGVPTRLKRADFPTNVLNGPFGTLIPYPQERLNLAAFFKPLSFEVWSSMVGATVLILIGFRFLIWSAQYFGIENRLRFRYAQFVLGNLVSQGQYCKTKRPTILVASGAWCIGTFFLIQIYCSTLTSHLLSPNQKPIVKSFYDIADTPGVSLTVDKLYALDMILEKTESMHLKRLSKMLKDNPSLRCSIRSECLNKVSSGYAVYSGPDLIVLKEFNEDFTKHNGTCRFSMLKESVMSTDAFTLLQKNSPYTEHISRGILTLKAAGFLDLWRGHIGSAPMKCMEINRRERKKQRLSLGHLSSAFLILGVGCSLSVTVFLFEFCASRIRAKRSNKH